MLTSPEVTQQCLAAFIFHPRQLSGAIEPTSSAGRMAAVVGVSGRRTIKVGPDNDEASSAR